MSKIDELYASIGGRFEVFSVASGEALSVPLTLAAAMIEAEAMSYGSGAEFGNICNGIDVRRIKQ